MDQWLGVDNWYNTLVCRRRCRRFCESVLLQTHHVHTLNLFTLIHQISIIFWCKMKLCTKLCCSICFMSSIFCTFFFHFTLVYLCFGCIFIFQRAVVISDDVSCLLLLLRSFNTRKTCWTFEKHKKIEWEWKKIGDACFLTTSSQRSWRLMLKKLCHQMCSKIQFITVR